MDKDPVDTSQLNLETGTFTRHSQSTRYLACCRLSIRCEVSWLVRVLLAEGWTLLFERQLNRLSRLRLGATCCSGKRWLGESEIRNARKLSLGYVHRQEMLHPCRCICLYPRTHTCEHGIIDMPDQNSITSAGTNVQTQSYIERKQGRDREYGGSRNST